MGVITITWPLSILGNNR